MAYPKKSTLGIKFPTYRNYFFQTGDNWYDGKRIDDNTDGYWRIHDKLYDFGTFVNKHPGGPDWLQITKGTDITEAFEAHHISTYPESLLARYYVRDATERRQSPFTFHEDGYYMTLKRQIREKLHEIPKSIETRSKLVSDILLLSFVLTSLIAIKWMSWSVAIVSGLFLGMLCISAHNFFHQRNNFRMYYFDLSFMSSRGWRISHALSHHMYPNTIKDYEISVYEPYFNFLPHDKSNLLRYLTAIWSPVVYAFTFYVHYIFHAIQFVRRNENLRPESLLTFLLFAALYFASGMPFWYVFKMFMFIQFVGSLHCTGVALNVGHHDPMLFHDGDAPRPKDELDFGVHQVDTIVGSTTTTGNQFVVLTSFGDHALHHLFPAIDQGKHKYLYPIFWKVSKEFGVRLHHKSSPQLVWALLMQLLNVRQNSTPPKPLNICKKVNG